MNTPQLNVIILLKVQSHNQCWGTGAGEPGAYTFYREPVKIIGSRSR